MLFPFRPLPIAGRGTEDRGGVVVPSESGLYPGAEKSALSDGRMMVEDPLWILHSAGIEKRESSVSPPSSGTTMTVLEVCWFVGQNGVEIPPEAEQIVTRV